MVMFVVRWFALNVIQPCKQTLASSVHFFVAHGLVLVGALYLVWSGQARPRPGSIWKAMLGLNTFAAIAGIFDLFFKTNYMYLRAKPRNPSLLDFLGPWPWYLAAS